VKHVELYNIYNQSTNDGNICTTCRKNYVEGAINYHNAIIPAINLKKLLNLDCSDKDSKVVRLGLLLMKSERLKMLMRLTLPCFKMKSQYITDAMKLNNNILPVIPISKKLGLNIRI